MQRSFQDLLSQRHSVRAFTKDPVAKSDLEKICQAARKAPSGANLQPGKFHVLTGPALEGLICALHDAMERNEPPVSEYSYFPIPMPADLKARQRAAGYALYQALGIAKRDVAGRREQFARNYAFFDAPRGRDRHHRPAHGQRLLHGSGMSLMTFLLAAEDQGLGATGIGALANYGNIVHSHLNLPEDELVVCGIAVGKKDETAPVNLFRTERDALDVFTSFHGFDD